jgi:hypothetical protein
MLAPSLPIALAQADPEAIAWQFIEAHNRGDIEAALALLADDAMVVNAAGDLCAPSPCVGKAAIRRQLEWWVAVGTQYTTISAQVSGTTVTARLELRRGLVSVADAEPCSPHARGARREDPVHPRRVQQHRPADRGLRRPRARPGPGPGRPGAGADSQERVAPGARSPCGSPLVRPAVAAQRVGERVPPEHGAGEPGGDPRRVLLGRPDPEDAALEAEPPGGLRQVLGQGAQPPTESPALASGEGRGRADGEAPGRPGPAVSHPRSPSGGRERAADPVAKAADRGAVRPGPALGGPGRRDRAEAASGLEPGPRAGPTLPPPRIPPGPRPVPPRRREHAHHAHSSTAERGAGCREVAIPRRKGSASPASPRAPRRRLLRRGARAGSAWRGCPAATIPRPARDGEKPGRLARPE